MLSIDKARQVILNNVKETPAVTVDLMSAAGACLAKDIYSPLPIPLFDNSAMDGYAVRAADLRGASQKKSIRLKIIEEIPAGHIPRQRIKRGEAALIMTGAMFPAGADTVVVVEATKREGKWVQVFCETGKGENIRKKGEVIRRGERLLKACTLIRPPEAALLATVNKKMVSVYRRPRVALISTGSEVVPLGRRLGPGQIVDSNRYGVMLQLKACGADVIDLGLVRDDREAIKRKLIKGIRRADVVITIGGVSVGQWDFVKEAVAGLGRIIFWKVKMKPGGPLTFGKIRDKLYFGLPGNPVSTLVVFEQMVRPALLKMSGRRDYLKPVFTAVLERDYHGQAGKVRLERIFLRYKNGKYFARPMRSLGSGDMRSLTAANGLMIVPANISRLRKGQLVSAQFIGI
jgi:molybdopterin molybdotransferase